MPRSVATPPAGEPVDTSTLERFLLSYVGANPGCAFGPLVLAAQRSCHVARATAARHLARLVRFGELTLLPDRTYRLGEPTSPPDRPVVEVRWFSGMISVDPDGSARITTQRELRVISGRLPLLEFLEPPGARRFVFWTDAAGRLSRVPASRSRLRRPSYRFEPESPLTARRTAWHRFVVHGDFAGAYQMVRAAGRPARRSAGRDESTRQSEEVSVTSQTPLYAQRLSPDAQLRLHVALPERYPVGRAHCWVRFANDPRRFDEAEEARVAALGRDRSHSDGLRQYGSTLVLSVPRPHLDRLYEIGWTLPRPEERRRWLASASARSRGQD
jgi:hypothetical protein